MVFEGGDRRGSGWISMVLWEVAGGEWLLRGCWGVQWGLWPAAPFGTLADRGQKHAGSAWPGTSGDSRQTGGSRCAVGFVGKPGSTTHQRASLQRRSRQRQSIRLIDSLTVRRCDALRCAAIRGRGRRLTFEFAVAGLCVSVQPYDATGIGVQQRAAARTGRAD